MPFVALMAACSFDSGSDSGPMLPEVASSSTSGPETSTADVPDASRGTTDAQTGSPEGSSGTPGEGDSSLPETTAPGTTSGESGETSGDTEATTDPKIDCTVPITITRLANEGELFPPMSLGEFQGVAYAYSEQFGAGAIRFTYDVECPSMFRLFARVRDDDPGTNNCCDPDSFDIEGPDELDVSWFYGCDTQSVGWNWVQVESGVQGGTCDQPAPVVLSLSAGVHEFTVRNRESNYFDARAGIAALTLTNDPAFVP